jgi:hypothetical protein
MPLPLASIDLQLVCIGNEQPQAEAAASEPESTGGGGVTLKEAWRPQPHSSAPAPRQVPAKGPLEDEAHALLLSAALGCSSPTTINIDVSLVVSGHLEYRLRAASICRALGLLSGAGPIGSMRLDFTDAPPAKGETETAVKHCRVYD